MAHLVRITGPPRRIGLAIAALAAAGMIVSFYLAAVKLTGGTPSCGLVAGCDTVNSSSYSVFMGIPLALFGGLGSAGVLAGALAWWHLGRRWALLGAYVIGLASLPVLVYLTYLELFVIGAICIWCVTYALTVIGAWLLSMLAIRAG